MVMAIRSLRGSIGWTALALGMVMPVAAVPAMAATYDGGDPDSMPAVTYPVVAETGATAKDFIPAGWVLETEQRGDLNKDGRADLALVVRMNDPANVLTNEGMGDNPFDTNPRMLVAALAEADGRYRRVLANHTLIRRRDNPVEDDIYKGMTIAQGLLRISLTNFMNAGGWGTWNGTYAFRYQGQEFVLVGYDRSFLHRGSGETIDISINYLTRQRKTVTGSIEDTKPGKPVWSREKPLAPITLESIPDGMMWHPDYPDGYPDETGQ